MTRSVRPFAVTAGLAILLAACPKAAPPATTADASAAVSLADDDDDDGVEPPALPSEFSLAEVGEKLTGDFEQIKGRKTLRVLVTGTEEAFLPRQGMPTSLDRTLVQEYASRQGLEVRFLLVPSYDELIRLLEDGRGDLAAAQLTVTKARQERVAFTRPINTVEEPLVASKSASDVPRSVDALSGRTVYVASRAHAETLEGLKTTVKDLKVELVERVEPEELVYRVSRGELPLTVSDSHVLTAIAAYNDAFQPLFSLSKGRQIAWAVRKDAPQLKSSLDAFLIEKALSAHTEELSTTDLEGIKKRGAIRVLTRNNPVTYFLHKGEQRGFDYDLAKLLSKELGVRLEMVVVPSRDQLVPWLLEGRGDLIAASLTVTPERKEQVAFSTPYLYVEEVLVSGKKGPKLTSLADLKGQKVLLRPSSSYVGTLKALAEATGPVEMVTADEALETEQLIAQVARGDAPFTVADSHILKAELAFRDDVDVALVLATEPPKSAWDDLTSGSKEIAFAVRPTNPKLKEAVDRFVKKTYRGMEYNMARKRYFENPRKISEAKSERVGVGGQFSQYDELIKKYSAKYGLDWRLMAALAYQESRFDPTVKSWVGAIGLFQTMPTTAREMGFENPEDPEQSTHAGIKYVHYLLTRIDPSIPFKHRVRFAMAAYNAGLGHVEDAQRLAASMGLNPKKWFKNVETAMLLLEQPKHYKKARYGYCRGSEPVQYVSQIQNRYDNWVKVVKE